MSDGTNSEGSGVGKTMSVVALLLALHGMAHAANLKPMDALLADLDSADVLRSQMAASGLSDYAEAGIAARRALLGALDHPEKGVRLAARHALGRAGPASAAALEAWDGARRERVAARIAAPLFDDLLDASVTLRRRGACEAQPPAISRPCPEYTVRVYADGTVRYDANGSPEGSRALIRSREEVIGLIRKFGILRFHELRDEYLRNAKEEEWLTGDVGHHPKQFHTLRLAIAGVRIEVERYGGDPTTPAPLIELESAVDRFAGLAP